MSNLVDHPYYKAASALARLLTNVVTVLWAATLLVQTQWSPTYAIVEQVMMPKVASICYLAIAGVLLFRYQTKARPGFVDRLGDGAEAILWGYLAFALVATTRTPDWSIVATIGIAAVAWFSGLAQRKRLV